MGHTSQFGFFPVITVVVAMSGGLFVLPGAIAQAAAAPSTVKIVEPAAPLLPKQFGAWQQEPGDAGAAATSKGAASMGPASTGAASTGAASTGAASTGAASTGAASDDPTTRSVLYEDGLSRTADSTYKRDGSSETLALKAYQFGDATGAYSAFTLLRTADFKPVPDAKLAATAVQKGDTVLLWTGVNVVAAEFHGGHRLADLASLVGSLPKADGTKGLPPLLPTTLPAKGLQAQTLKYALGSSGYEAMGGVLPAGIVGFDKSAEVVTAKYAGRGTLTLLLYPTPQIAGDHGRQIEAEMNRQGKSAGTVKLRREGVLLLLTTGNWQPEDAKQLIDNTHLNLQVSYDKPLPLEFHAEVRKTATLLSSIVELSAALMLAAVVIGLFFGGGRAAIRVLQGKPAASEPEFLRIDLRDRPGEGGQSKRLR